MEYWQQQMVDARRIAKTIPKRLARCGDILDCLPCVQCGAERLRDCPVTTSEATPVVNLINTTTYLGDVLRREAAALNQSENRHGE